MRNILFITYSIPVCVKIYIQSSSTLIFKLGHMMDVKNVGPAHTKGNADYTCTSISRYLKNLQESQVEPNTLLIIIIVYTLFRRKN